MEFLVLNQLKSIIYLVSKLYCGLLMNSNFGKKFMNTFFTHGAIRCVCGLRKWTLSTTTVTQILQHHKYVRQSNGKQPQTQSIPKSDSQYNNRIHSGQSTNWPIDMHTTIARITTTKNTVEERKKKRKREKKIQQQIIIWKFAIRYTNKISIWCKLIFELHRVIMLFHERWSGEISWLRNDTQQTRACPISLWRKTDFRPASNFG